MSGGYFEYSEYKIEEIMDRIQLAVETNHIPDEDGFEHVLSDETIAEFKNAIKHLKIAYIYVHRIDWLLSGDDGEEDFHANLKEELEELYDGE